MNYAVKEAYITLQGEGAQVGRVAVFCRFAGCNLWSGREADRATAICRFCDTAFVGTDGPGGGHFPSAAELATHLRERWDAAAGVGRPLVVFTGGEPMLQIDDALVEACHQLGMELAIETNGTLPVPRAIDWITVSPKAESAWVQLTGDELKLAFPQPGASPDEFASLAFEHFFLQPIDGPELAAHTAEAIAYCKAHPQWRLSVQTHKLLGLP